MCINVKREGRIGVAENISHEKRISTFCAHIRRAGMAKCVFCLVFYASGSANILRVEAQAYIIQTITVAISEYIALVFVLVIKTRRPTLC